MISNFEDKYDDKSSYKTLWIMLILFGLPYLAALYFYLFQDDIDFSYSNNGELISPVRPLENHLLKDISNKDVWFSSFKGKWLIIMIGDSSCNQICQSNMYKMRQIRKAVGQDRQRVDRIFFLNDDKTMGDFNQKIKEYPGMHIIKNNGDEYDRFLSGLLINNKKMMNRIYIIDPLGNFMMAYQQDSAAEHILDDLRRLLKVSKLG